MKPEDVLRKLDRGALKNVELHYIDRTRGETEESFVVFGKIACDLDDESFTAAALLAIAVHMGCDEADLADLKVVPWTDEHRERARMATIKPGQVNSYPPEDLINFKLPNEVKPRFFIEPDIGGLEECFLCSSSNGPLLLYWHTTG
jgi:hypothetical protein